MKLLLDGPNHRRLIVRLPESITRQSVPICLSKDRNTVVMWDHYKSEMEMVKQFEKHGIDIVFVPLTYSHFFNQGVTCLTLDLHRHTPEGLVKY